MKIYLSILIVYTGTQDKHEIICDEDHEDQNYLLDYVAGALESVITSCCIPSFRSKYLTHDDEMKYEFCSIEGLQDVCEALREEEHWRGDVDFISLVFSHDIPTTD